MPKFTVLLLLAIFPLFNLSTQGLEGIKNTDKAILIYAGYGPQSPSGDLSDRFGNTWGIELGVDYIAKESNWLFGVFGQYIFGSQVNEDVVANLRTRDGFIIGNQRDPADIQLRMRGYFAGARIGKIIPFGDNKRSGLKVAIGAGWMEHRIRIQNDVNQSVNQLVGDYRSGYDRLSSGPALYQFLGYQNMSVNGRINFYAGAELFEGFTQSRRDFDYATGNPIDESRLDLLAGFRLGIILPLYQGDGREIFYR
ncbi:MAG: hypothetical protein AAF828_06455 [Bacteroidota bacterium]